MASKARQVQSLIKTSLRAMKGHCVQTVFVRPLTTSTASVINNNPASQARVYSSQVQEAVQASHSHPYVVETFLNGGKRWLGVKWEDGSRTDFPYVWLRDNCQCENCFHPTSQARLLLMRDLELNVEPKHVEVSNSGKIHMVWPDGHESHFDPAWLKEHSFTKDMRQKRSELYKFERELWGASSIKRNLPRGNFEEIMTSDLALYNWLSEFRKYGLGVINNMSGKGSMLKFCNRIAFPKFTHYGEMFEVMTKPDPSNLTYTSASLGLHTDLTYYDYQPGIQLLNCVQQAEGIGGDNGFVDAFKVGYTVKENRPDLYRALTTVPLDSWDTGNDFRDFYKVVRSPVIRLDEHGEIWQIRYNNQVRDSFMDMDVNMVGPMYEALKEFDNTCYLPELTTKMKLKSGEMVVFDNWRVLHSRDGFTASGKVERYLEGGFMEWDELHSTIRLLRQKLNP